MDWTEYCSAEIQTELKDFTPLNHKSSFTLPSPFHLMLNKNIFYHKLNETSLF